MMRYITDDHRIVGDIATPFLKNGGKRLRPILVLLSADISGRISPDTVRYAAVVELIHNASLFHDDVLDDANTRRGRLSANTALGNHMAILAGDFFYTKALSIVINDPEIIRKKINHCVLKVIEGEILQAANQYNLSISHDTYMKIVEQKTAILMAISCQLGAISSNNEQLFPVFYNFGKLIGTAYQLIDDLLDWEATESMLGKPTLQDIREGRITLPALLLIEKLPEKDRIVFQNLISNPADSDLEIQLAPFIQKMKEYGIFAAVQSQAEKLTRDALGLLHTFSNSPALKDMNALVQSLIHREY